MLIVEIREKWTQLVSTNQHLNAYLRRHGIEYRIEALDVGDYMLEGGKISVDRKQNLDELAKNLTNKSDHARFMREVRRAYAARITLIVLVEQRGIKGTNDVLKWRSKHSGVTGSAVVREMFRLQMAYGVKFLFCDKLSTGRRIMEILTGGANDLRG
jgi:ERCC4-type nuclease